MASETSRVLSPGSIVKNRYRVEKTLGEGGFGVTYLVTDQKENVIRAMKEYMPLEIAVRGPKGDAISAKQGCREAYERFRKQFEDEARIIYSYRGHPNIVEVYHLFEWNNTRYYVMEFIDGTDLKKMLDENDGKLPWETLEPILSQVASALHTVHQKNTVHCDISPDNIRITNEGRAKLLDFGAAKSMMYANATGIQLKKGFAPPEQEDPTIGKMGPWTDVYAMAATIYRAYTGKMPPAAHARQKKDSTVWPSQMGMTTPSQRWEQVLQKAMALDIKDRYQNVGDFWMDITETQAKMQVIPSLEGIQGYYAGSRVEIRDAYIVGTDPTRCHILYPPGTPGVSRVHMRVWAENGEIFVMDMGSTYGTWLGFKKMVPGLVYVMPSDAILYMGDGQVFRSAAGAMITQTINNPTVLNKN